MALLGALLSATAAGAQEGPTYDAPETRAIVERVLEAHGGLEAWRRAETIAFDHVMFTPHLLKEGDTRWWTSREVVHKPTGRLYQEWPVDGARMAFDGTRVWSVGWKRPNSPQGMARVHYRFLFLPWLTQDEGTVLARGDDETLPGDDRASLTVTMALPGGEGPPMALFVDPDTYQLRGFGYGPARHRIDRFGDADGLSVPIDWTTTVEGRVIGHHLALHVTLDAPWDPARLVPPSDAVIAGR